MHFKSHIAALVPPMDRPDRDALYTQRLQTSRCAFEAAFGRRERTQRITVCVCFSVMRCFSVFSCEAAAVWGWASQCWKTVSPVGDRSSTGRAFCSCSVLRQTELDTRSRGAQTAMGGAELERHTSIWSSLTIASYSVSRPNAEGCPLTALSWG